MQVNVPVGNAPDSCFDVPVESTHQYPVAATVFAAIAYVVPAATHATPCAPRLALA